MEGNLVKWILENLAQAPPRRGPYRRIFRELPAGIATAKRHTPRADASTVSRLSQQAVEKTPGHFVVHQGGDSPGQPRKASGARIIFFRLWAATLTAPRQRPTGSKARVFPEFFAVYRAVSSSSRAGFSAISMLVSLAGKPLPFTVLG
jgi:hypothetical protein